VHQHVQVQGVEGDTACRVMDVLHHAVAGKRKRGRSMEQYKSCMNKAHS
jgi:hypothetical protein